MARQISRWKKKKNIFGKFDSRKSLAYFEEIKESHRGWHLVRGRESGLNEMRTGKKKKDSLKNFLDFPRYSEKPLHSLLRD